MKNIEEQLNNLQKTVMNTKEHDAVRGAVVSYMQENPVVLVRNSEDSRLLKYQRAKMPIVNNHLITKIRMTIAIIIALLLGGGTSFAAENALPGDVLYPIKIYVNENVQELAAVSDKAEAKVQAHLAERRLEEAEKLAVGGKLTAETSADIKARFEKHLEKSKERRMKVQEKSDAEAVADISSDIEVSLGIHQNLLMNIEDAKPEMRGFVGGLLDGIRLHLRDASEDRANIEAKIFAGAGGGTEASAQGTMKAAQNKIDEVKKYIENRKGKLSLEIYAEAGAKIKTAEAAMAEGKAKIEAKAYADAFALFKKAAREAQSAQLFAVTAGNLKIEIKDKGGVRLEVEEEHKNEVKESEDRKSDDKDEASVNTEIKIEANGEVEVDDDRASVDGGTKIRLGL